jgi:hypothetical protein
MNRLYVIFQKLIEKGYKEILVFYEKPEISNIEEYMTYLNPNEDIDGDIQEIILSPKEIFICLVENGIHHKLYQVVV